MTDSVCLFSKDILSSMRYRVPLSTPFYLLAFLLLIPENFWMLFYGKVMAMTKGVGVTLPVTYRLPADSLRFEIPLVSLESA